MSVAFISLTHPSWLVTSKSSLNICASKHSNVFVLVLAIQVDMDTSF